MSAISALIKQRELFLKKLRDASQSTPNNINYSRDHVQSIILLIKSIRKTTIEIVEQCQTIVNDCQISYVYTLNDSLKFFFDTPLANELRIFGPYNVFLEQKPVSTEDSSSGGLPPLHRLLSHRKMDSPTFGDKADLPNILKENRGSPQLHFPKRHCRDDESRCASSCSSRCLPSIKISQNSKMHFRDERSSSLPEIAATSMNDPKAHHMHKTASQAQVFPFEHGHSSSPARLVSKQLNDSPLMRPSSGLGYLAENDSPLGSRRSFVDSPELKAEKSVTFQDSSAAHSSSVLSLFPAPSASPIPSALSLSSQNEDDSLLPIPEDQPKPTRSSAILQAWKQKVAERILVPGVATKGGHVDVADLVDYVDVAEQRRIKTLELLHKIVPPKPAGRDKPKRRPRCRSTDPCSTLHDGHQELLVMSLRRRAVILNEHQDGTDSDDESRTAVFRRLYPIMSPSRNNSINSSTPPSRGFVGSPPLSRGGALDQSFDQNDFLGNERGPHRGVSSPLKKVRGRVNSPLRSPSQTDVDPQRLENAKKFLELLMPQSQTDDGEQNLPSLS